MISWQGTYELEELYGRKNEVVWIEVGWLRGAGHVVRRSEDFWTKYSTKRQEIQDLFFDPKRRRYMRLRTIWRNRYNLLGKEGTRHSEPENNSECGKDSASAVLPKKRKVPQRERKLCNYWKRCYAIESKENELILF